MWSIIARTVGISVTVAISLIGDAGAGAGAGGLQADEPCSSGPRRTLVANDVSQRVYGSYTAGGSATGELQLCLLVLWRGEAGWHIHREKALKAHGEKLMDELRENGQLEEKKYPFPLRTFTDDLGDLTISYHYDWENHRVHLLGEELEPGGNNVILIDWIDGVGGEPQVLQMLRIDPHLSLLSDDIRQIADRSPIIRSFIQ